MAKKKTHEPLKFEPLYDRVLVKRIEVPEESEGGILLPEVAKEKSQEGIVIGVGPGRLNPDGQIRPMTLKEGDRVMFGRYGGTQIFIGTEEHLILREDEVLGRITGGGLEPSQYLAPR